MFNYNYLKTDQILHISSKFEMNLRRNIFESPHSPEKCEFKS